MARRMGDPILDYQAARTWEEAAMGRDPERAYAVMEVAGREVARFAGEVMLEFGSEPTDPEVLVLAGAGHNGGDAILAANHWLSTRPGARLTILLAESEGRLRPNTARALAECRQQQPSTRICLWPDGASSLAPRCWSLVIDGLLGMGASGPLRSPAKEIIEWANQDLAVEGLRVSVDLPSGLAESGFGLAFRADLTVATGIFKEPLADPRALPWCGRLRLAELGFNQVPPPVETGFRVLTDSTLAPLRRLRPAASDKRSYGHVFVLAGSRAMPGAALLAVLGALRSGAGLVTAFVPGPIAHRMVAAAPEAMWFPLPVGPDGTLGSEAMLLLRQNVERADALVVGPGLDPDKPTRHLVGRVVREIPTPLVLDASATQPDVLPAALTRPPGFGPVVVTPHFGEYGRMLEVSPPVYDRQELLQFSARHRFVTVLKGSLTRVCDGTRIAHSPRGGPVLARGGSGDILAGMVGARLAADPSDPFAGACQAVYWHGLAADWLAAHRGGTALRTSELTDFLAPALRCRHITNAVCQRQSL